MARGVRFELVDDLHRPDCTPRCSTRKGYSSSGTFARCAITAVAIALYSESDHGWPRISRDADIAGMNSTTQNKKNTATKTIDVPISTGRPLPKRNGLRATSLRRNEISASFEFRLQL